MNEWTTTAMKDKMTTSEVVASMAQMLNGLSAMGADTHQMVKEFSKLKGIPLSCDITMVMHLKMAKGAPAMPASVPSTFDMSMNSVVQSISESAVDASMFKIPAGYTKSKRAGMPGMGAGKG
jgi:hypothetical protein